MPLNSAAGYRMHRAENANACFSSSSSSSSFFFCLLSARRPQHATGYTGKQWCSKPVRCAQAGARARDMNPNRLLVCWRVDFTAQGASWLVRNLCAGYCLSGLVSTSFSALLADSCERRQSRARVPGQRTNWSAFASPAVTTTRMSSFAQARKHTGACSSSTD